MDWFLYDRELRHERVKSFEEDWLIHPWWRSLSYRSQSIDLLCKRPTAWERSVKEKRVILLMVLDRKIQNTNILRTILIKAVTNKQALNKIHEYLIFPFRIYQERNCPITKWIKQIFHAVHAKYRIIYTWVNV